MQRWGSWQLRKNCKVLTLIQELYSIVQLLSEQLLIIDTKNQFLYKDF